MKLKNAGFKNTNKSRKKALIRMIKGEVFYSKENAKLYFDLKNGMQTGNYFMMETRLGTINSLMGILNFMDEWQVEDREAIEKLGGEFQKVLDENMDKLYEEDIDPAIGGFCWVNDSDKNLKYAAVKIDRKHADGKYIDIDGVRWEYAIRLTNEELESFKSKK